MKKTNNKGFSLVELIIVIAIMAILAGAIAPALIRYIDKSRKSNDVSAAKTIKTSVETALGNETIYEYLTAAANADGVFIEIVPGKKTSSGSGSGATACVLIADGQIASTYEAPEGKDAAAVKKLTQEEIATNIGESTPKLKFKKAADDNTTNKVPERFYVVVSPKGSVVVYIAYSGVATSAALVADTVDDGIYQMCPTLCDEYQ